MFGGGGWWPLGGGGGGWSSSLCSGGGVVEVGVARKRGGRREEWCATHTKIIKKLFKSEFFKKAKQNLSFSYFTTPLVVCQSPQRSFGFLSSSPPRS